MTDTIKPHHSPNYSDEEKSDRLERAMYKVKYPEQYKYWRAVAKAGIERIKQIELTLKIVEDEYDTTIPQPFRVHKGLSSYRNDAK